VPIDALQFVELGNPRLPEFQEDIRYDPLLKPIMRGGLGT